MRGVAVREMREKNIDDASLVQLTLLDVDVEGWGEDFVQRLKHSAEYHEYTINSWLCYYTRY